MHEPLAGICIHSEWIFPNPRGPITFVRIENQGPIKLPVQSCMYKALGVRVLLKSCRLRELIRAFLELIYRLLHTRLCMFEYLKPVTLKSTMDATTARHFYSGLSDQLFEYSV